MRGRDRLLTGSALASRTAQLYQRSFIKSTQRGVATLANGVASQVVTITAVDINNARVRFLGEHVVTGGNADSGFARIAFTSSTQLTVIRVGATGAINVSWEVTEYVPGVIKSVQRGLMSIAATGSVTQAITAVDVTKTQLDLLGWVTTDTASGAVCNYNGRLELTNSTTLTLTASITSGATVAIGYQVMEFY